MEVLYYFTSPPELITSSPEDSTLTFQHTDDIDGNKATFIPRVNEQFTTAVNRVINAMEKVSGVESEFRTTISLLLQSLLYTHKSIIVLLRHGNEERYDPGADEKETPPRHDTQCRRHVSSEGATGEGFCRRPSLRRPGEVDKGIPDG